METVNLTDLQRDPPPPPRRILRSTARAWEKFWQSPIASVIMHQDLPALYRYFESLDIWARAIRELKREPVTTGSMGQLVLSPLASLVLQRESVMKDLEERFGMTPLSRSRLGITMGAERLTARELRRRLLLDDDEDEVAPA